MDSVVASKCEASGQSREMETSEDEKSLGEEVVSWTIKVRNEIIPPTSYSSGHASRTVLEIGKSHFVDNFASRLMSGCKNSADNLGELRKLHVVCRARRTNDHQHPNSDDGNSDSDAEVVRHDTEDFGQWLLSDTYSSVIGEAIIFVDLETARAADDDDKSLCKALCAVLEKGRSPMIIIRLLRSLFWKVCEDVCPIFKMRKLPDESILIALVNNNVEDRLRMMPTLAKRVQKDIPSVTDRTQFGVLKDDILSRSDIGIRITQFVSNSAALYKCPLGKKRMLERLNELIMADRPDDEKVYEALAKTFHEEVKTSEEHVKVHGASKQSKGGSSYRFSKRIQDVSKLLPRDFVPRKYLDIGCAEGSITAPLGAHFRLQPRNIIGCDIRDVPTTEGMQFELYDGENLKNHADGSLCLVTMIMSLHHVRRPTKLLSEVGRVLRSGGFLVIREHDCSTPRIALALDVQHGLFAKVWSDPPEWPNFCREYFACYRSRQDWTRMIQESGKLTHMLRWRDQERMYEPNSERKCPNGGEPYIRNPGSTYWAVYQKESRSSSSSRNSDLARSMSRKRGFDDRRDRRSRPRYGSYSSGHYGSATSMSSRDFRQQDASRATSTSSRDFRRRDASDRKRMRLPEQQMNERDARERGRNWTKRWS